VTILVIASHHLFASCNHYYSTVLVPLSTMSEYFARVANEVLRATEEITTIMEDGIAAMIKGELPGMKIISDITETVQDNEFDGIEDHMMMNSPLEGIAESVLGDLMKNSVS
jgi:hypothetical protein